MGRPHVYLRLSGEEEAEVEGFIKASRSHMERRRGQAILFSHRGRTKQEAAELLGVCVRAVDCWWALYRKGGVEGLKNAPRRKKNPKVSGERERALVEVVRQAPESVGKQANQWTCGLLADWLEDTFEVRVSDEWVRQILLKHGLRFRRAKLKLTSPDPDYAQKKRRLTA